MARDDELPPNLRPTREGGLKHRRSDVPTDVSVGEFYDRMVTQATTEGLLASDNQTAVGIDSSGFIRPFLDTCATTMHILSFYQGRILDEGFLQSADEQRSIFELAKMLGIRRRPALSAETYCSLFAVEIPGDGLAMTVDQGMPIQSVPIKGGLPQIFETTEAVDVHPDWNEMGVSIESDDAHVRILGSAQCLVIRGTLPSMAPGAPLLIRGTVDGEPIELIKVVSEIGRIPRRSLSVLAWDEPLLPDRPEAVVLDPEAEHFTVSHPLMGADAPPWGDLSIDEQLQYSEAVGGTFFLTNGATEWTRQDHPGDVAALFSASNGETYAGLLGGGVHRSVADGGWEPANAGLRNADVLCLSEDATGSLLAGTRTKGVYRSPDGGTTWNPLQGLSSIVGAWPRVKRVDARLPDTPVRCILPCTDSTGQRPTVLVGTDAGVFSFDQVSAQWQPINEGLPGWEPGGKEALTSVRSLAVNPRTGAVFAATDQGLFVAPRLNKPWVERMVAGADDGVRCVAVDPAGVAFVGLESGGIATSADAGTNWVRVGETLPKPMSARTVHHLHAIRDDAAGREWVFATTNDGVWQSIDRGARWTRLTTGLRSQSITAASITPAGTIHLCSPITGVVDDEWPAFGLAADRITLAKSVPTARRGVTAILEQTTPGVEQPARTILRVHGTVDVERNDFGSTAKGTQLQLSEDAFDASQFNRREAVCHYGPKSLSLPMVQIRHPEALVSGNQTFESLVRQPETFARATADRIHLNELPRASVFMAQGLSGFEGRTIGIVGRAIRVRCKERIHLHESRTNRTLPYPAGTEFTLMAWPSTGEDHRLQWSLRDSVGIQGGCAADEAAMTIIPADPNGPEIARIRRAESCLHRHRGTHIDLDLELDVPLDPSTLIVHGNVVHAHHGFRVEEVLGNGDATAFNQRFQLRQGPLSWTATGASYIPDIHVIVSGNTWSHRTDLDEAGPDDLVFTVRLDHDGHAWVVFGDGIHGARVPTGLENVTAHFRIGSGTQGNVEQGHIRLLRQRPPMVRRVLNLVAASGGTEPETAEELRVRLPLTVRASRRIVSRTDLEDHIRTAPGVRHVLAQHVWGGDHRVLCLTVTTTNASAEHRLTRSDPLYLELRRRLDTLSESVEDTVEILGHRSVECSVEVDLLVDGTIDCSAAEQQGLETVLSLGDFEQRGLMHPLSRSEIMASLSQIDGVLNATVTMLRTVDGPLENLSCIEAHAPRWSTHEGRILPAECLVLRPQHIRIQARQVDS